MIHETVESDFSAPFPGLRGTTSGTQPYSFSYPGNVNIPNSFEDPFVSPEQTYTTRASNMNTMSRSLLPSSRNARNPGLGGPGTGAGVTRRSSQQQGRMGIATNQAVTRAALGMAGNNPGQASNPGPFSTVDLTGMDYNIGSPGSMGLYGSTLNSGVDPNPFMSNTYDPFSSTGGSAQQGQGAARDTSPVPKFDPELLSDSPQFISPMQYETFEEEEQRETKPDARRFRTEGTPTRAPRAQRASMAMANIPPATPDVNSPVDSSFEASSGGGGGGGVGSSSGRRAPQTPAYQAHVPPNRIAEAGPVTHPDPEWRPYGTNHWHVFLREPTLLKYLSSTEIKDIREHCFAMAAKGADDGDNDGDGNDQQPRPVALGSQYTTADARAVWKHCDAYIRRRSQVRNNQAARRSRQRKDAETRYWKTLAVQYGAPDHEFDWGLVDEDGNLPAHISAPAAAPARTGTAAAAAEGSGGAGAGVQTRARARAQQQQQQRAAAANRRASASSSGAAARPDFDFNQPLGFDEDDNTIPADFDPFGGEF